MNIQRSNQINKRLSFVFGDREYFRRLFNIGIPIVLQQLVTSSLNLVGQVMIGQLGEVAVASVGLANQIFFLLSLLLFGITSGLAIFTAQFWGASDEENIHRVQGLAILLGLMASTLFFLASQFFPEALMGIYSQDPAVVSMGGQYLRVFGWSFLFFSVQFSYALILRTVGQARLPMVVSIFALSLNVVVSYLLIFGVGPLPAFGVMGAAAGILISRIVECAVLLLLAYRLNTPVAASISQLLDIDMGLIKRVMPSAWPVALNELLWSWGITTYNIIYARISTESIAAVNIAAAIDQMAFVLFSGIAHGTSVLVGNWIGAGDHDQAYKYAGRSMIISFTVALLMGGLVLLMSPVILSWYKVSPEVLENARKILIVVAAFMWLRAMNIVLILGVFRSGGDTRFGLFLDGIIIWILGVPLAYLAAFWLHLPVYLVYVFVMSEEITKFVLGTRRYLTKRWIHNLANPIEANPVVVLNIDGQLD